ncbi:XUV2 [Auxenochlorella protothecoides x Auxenochlorella symbiontica]
MGYAEKINARVENSIVGRYFKVKERNTSFTQELRGGSVTFLTVAYILAVNAGILADTGGICPTNGACPLGPGSIGTAACDDCVANTKRSFISATAAICVIANFLMGIMGNLPLAIAPGMGLNAYFTYTVVGFFGTGMVTYQMALAAVFIEGFIFVFISVIGLRTWLTTIVPKSIWLASSAGIGAFLAFIGLQQAEGLGVVTYNGATAVGLGGCPPGYRNHQYTFSTAQLESACILSDGAAIANPANSGWTPSSNYFCESAGVMRSGQTWLGIAGGMLMAVLLAKNLKGALMVGILFVTFISWIPSSGNHAAYLGSSAGPGGQERLDYFRKVVAVPDTSYTAAQLDFSGFKTGQLWLALITFLYVDFLDCTGTLYSMANFLGLYIPNFIDKKTLQFERQLPAFCVDGVSITVGAVLGTSPVTVFVESASGIREGARTGIAALMISFWFIVSLFFTPLLASIPPYATGPALVLVGAMMVINIVKIDWANIQEAVPAFLTFIVMPLTYSIAYGVIAGIMSWIIINGSVAAWNYVSLKIWGRPDHVEEGSSWKMVRQMTFTLNADRSLQESEALHTFQDPSTRGMKDGDESPSASQAAAEVELGGKSVDTSVKP